MKVWWNYTGRQNRVYYFTTYESTYSTYSTYPCLHRFLARTERGLTGEFSWWAKKETTALCDDFLKGAGYGYLILPFSFHNPVRAVINRSEILARGIKPNWTKTVRSSGRRHLGPRIGNGSCNTFGMSSCRMMLCHHAINAL